MKKAVRIILRVWISIFNYEWNIIQYKWGRKLIGGNFYLIFVDQFYTLPFWSQLHWKQYGSIILKIENYVK